MKRWWLKCTVVAGCAALIVAMALFAMTWASSLGFGTGDAYIAALFWFLLLGAPVSLAESWFEPLVSFLGRFSVVTAYAICLVLNWMAVGLVIGVAADLVRRACRLIRE